MARRDSHIGTLIKPHGFRGELHLRVGEAYIENLESGIVLFVEIYGQRIPFFIEEIAIISASECIIKFEFIDSGEEARRFIGCRVYTGFEREEGSTRLPGSVAGLLGFIVCDQETGNEYIVTGYLEMEENPLLVLGSGKNEVLLPLNADYILEINSNEKVIRAIFPDGLV